MIKQVSFSVITALILHFSVAQSISWPFGSDKKDEKKLTDVQKLHKAAFEGKKADVEALLKKGVDVNAADEESGVTPLIAATMGNQPETVKLLLDERADVKATLKDPSLYGRFMNFIFRTQPTVDALYLAVEKTRDKKNSATEKKAAREIIKYLIDAGAEIGELLDLSDELSKTK